MQVSRMIFSRPVLIRSDTMSIPAIRGFLTSPLPSELACGRKVVHRVPRRVTAGSAPLPKGRTTIRHLSAVLPSALAESFVTCSDILLSKARRHDRRDPITRRKDYGNRSRFRRWPGVDHSLHQDSTMQDSKPEYTSPSLRTSQSPSSSLARSTGGNALRLEMYRGFRASMILLS